MKISITGSRGIVQYPLNTIPQLKQATQIVSGGTKGVDTIACLYANENNIPIVEFLPNYALYGKAAPIKRNAQILDNSDLAIIIWDGKSRGTLSNINYCKLKNIPYLLITA